MKRWKYWLPKLEAKEEAREVLYEDDSPYLGNSASFGAEYAAEQAFNEYSGELDGGFELNVIDDEGNVYKFDIEVEYEPTFNAIKKYDDV